MSESTDQGSAPTPNDELIDDICDRWLDSSAGWSTYAERYDYVPVVLEVLRSLPLEQRMAAMGMEPVGLAHQTCEISCVHFGEVDR
jgi:hypothetical protein